MPIRVLRNPNLETMSDGNVHTQSSNEDKTVKIMGDLVSSSLRVPCVPDTANIFALKGVPLNTLRDIDNLTKAIDLGATGGLKPELSKSKANFRSLFYENLCEGANVSIPRKVVETGKYGLTRIMMHSKGFFFFQFKTLKGLEDVLENGPWMIRSSPIILKKWSLNTRLCKEELTRILVWVRIHDVPIQGRSSFARCLIEINAGDDLKDSLTLGVPLIEGLGYTIKTVTIEYEWKPPRCDLCKIFGHIHDHCPKKVSSPPTIVTSDVVTPTVEKTNNGFQTVVTSTKKGNITMSNSYSALDDEDDEEVGNVYDELANIF
ncbi:zinc knuckle CX2CX4HX4C containing protein [Tanacetum coccineum]